MDKSNELGEFLFSLKLRHVGELFSCGFILFLVSIYLFLEGSIPLGILFFLGGAFGGYLILSEKKEILHCFEKGLCLESPSGKEELLYEKIESFEYHGFFKKDEEGLHPGEYVSMIILKPFAHLEKAPIVLGERVGGKDQKNLKDLVEMLTRIIFERMRDQHNQKKPVAWIPRLRFLPEKLEYQPINAWGKAEEKIFLPYDKILGVEMFLDETLIIKGEIQEASPGENLSFEIREGTRGENFLPGWKLLREICSPHS